MGGAAVLSLIQPVCPCDSAVGVITLEKWVFFTKNFRFFLQVNLVIYMWIPENSGHHLSFWLHSFHPVRIIRSLFRRRSRLVHYLMGNIIFQITIISDIWRTFSRRSAYNRSWTLVTLSSVANAFVALGCASSIESLRTHLCHMRSEQICESI